MAHAHCSPSSSAIWVACPASAVLTRGRERKATIYTREGSAAHVVAEHLVLGRGLGETGVEIDGEFVAFDDDMKHHAQLYADYIDLLRTGASWWAAETKVDVRLPVGLGPVFGTSDFAAARLGELDVVDFKYGRGHVVSPERNSQLMIYALGVMGVLPGRVPRQVRLHVVQPRADGEKIKVWGTSGGELLEWKRRVLIPALERIRDGDTTENPGDHCRWCVRLAECGAMRAKAQEIARGAFAPTFTSTVSDDEIATILDQAELISTWIARVRAEAAQRIEHGSTIKGWKLAAKRALRKWIDENDAADVLRGEIDDEFLFEPMALKSPAQIESAIKRLPGARKADLLRVLGNLVSKESSGTTLVREDDERDAVEPETAKSVFSEAE